MVKIQINKNYQPDKVNPGHYEMIVLLDLDGLKAGQDLESLKYWGLSLAGLTHWDTVPHCTQ